MPRTIPCRFSVNIWHLHGYTPSISTGRTKPSCVISPHQFHVFLSQDSLWSRDSMFSDCGVDSSVTSLSALAAVSVIDRLTVSMPPRISMGLGNLSHLINDCLVIYLLQWDSQVYLFFFSLPGSAIVLHWKSIKKPELIGSSSWLFLLISKHLIAIRAIINTLIPIYGIIYHPVELLHDRRSTQHNIRRFDV